MACNKDSGCLKIANSTYPGLKTEIDSSSTAITDNIQSVIDELSALSVPDDYLGEKVSSRLKTICTELTSDIASVKTMNSSIDGFIDEKITEHTNHYNAWKREQERLAMLKKKKQEENGIVRLEK